MKRFILAGVGMMALGTMACSTDSTGARQPSLATMPSADDQLTRGTIKGISSTHGNAYTTIRPEQYASLGLRPGTQVRVLIAGQELTLPVVKDYTDVASGAAAAVLHREGLTLAIRDGNFSQAHGVKEGQAFKLTVERP